VAASTATGRLNLLVAGGLLAQERQGRHRYVRPADAGTAELIERLASMAKPAAPQSGSLSAVSGRAVTLTDTGRIAFRQHLGLVAGETQRD
jgi:hypothetical protein